MIDVCLCVCVGRGEGGGRAKKQMKKCLLSFTLLLFSGICIF